MSIINLSVIIGTVLLSALAQLLFKLGVTDLSATQGIYDDGVQSIIKTVFSPLVLAGLLIYALSVVLWLWVLSRVELSMAYPFVGISFIATMLFGAFILNEPVNSLRIMGTILITAGCFFIARS